jgi:hypothetical protein
MATVAIKKARKVLRMATVTYESKAAVLGVMTS